jgi:hypothetical protein
LITTGFAGFNLFLGTMPSAEFEIFYLIIDIAWASIASHSLWATAPVLYLSLLPLPDTMWTTINISNLYL